MSGCPIGVGHDPPNGVLIRQRRTVFGFAQQGWLGSLPLVIVRQGLTYFWLISACAEAYATVLLFGFLLWGCSLQATVGLRRFRFCGCPIRLGMTAAGGARPTGVERDRRRAFENVLYIFWAWVVKVFIFFWEDFSVRWWRSFMRWASHCS